VTPLGPVPQLTTLGPVPQLTTLGPVPQRGARMTPALGRLCLSRARA
jgi:hypothetical protein